MLLHIQLYITRQARPYQNGSNTCNLYLEQKHCDTASNPANTLNQRTELVSKCRHKA